MRHDEPEVILTVNGIIFYLWIIEGFPAFIVYWYDAGMVVLGVGAGERLSVVPFDDILVVILITNV